MSSASATAQGFSVPLDTDNPLTLDHDFDFDPEPRNSVAPSAGQQHQYQHQQQQQQQQQQQRSSIDSNLLSPFLSRVNSDSLSPANPSETPAGSTSTLSLYQSSDFSDFDDDPFFGANFTNPEVGTPSFLDDQSVWDLSLNNTPPVELQPEHNANDDTYPLTPDQTASVHTLSPRSEERAALARPDQHQQPSSVSPQQLQKPFKPNPLVIPAPQLTPSQTDSARSSEDGLAPAPVDMRCQSPRVTISVWDKDNNGPVHTVERTFEDSPSTVRGGIESAGDLITSSINHGQSQAGTATAATANRDSMGQWRRDPATGLAGLDPKRRPGEEIASINEIISRREIEERNEEVGKWLTGNLNETIPPEKPSPEDISAAEEQSRHSNDSIPLGDQTENKYIPGQTYYSPNGAGQLSDEDYDIIYANRGWADAPILHSIRNGGQSRHQPQSSQAAIDRFERMCRDNDSIISRAATWGTRRRSLPSVVDLDIEGITSGNFLKKLSISRGGDKSNRSGSLLKDLRGLVRRPSGSHMRKRSRSRQGEAPVEQSEPSPTHNKRDSMPHLSPLSRTSSWGKKHQTPSINTALVSMGQNFASIGTTHSRAGSISTIPQAPSSKGPLSGLSVKNSLRRPRSKSDLPKPTVASSNGNNNNTDGAHSSLASMWRKSGGPPVAALRQAPVEPDEDEDEDDDFYEDNDMKMNPNIIDDITPNFAGFQQHIQTLNPGLPPAHSYLVDRIAHQQIVRYKQLLNNKVKHLGLGANCPCGSLCLALGGSANVLSTRGAENNGNTKGMDTLSTHYDDDDDVTPTEGAINQESFPTDIPMPPTQHLPAEFECQLCYQKKKFLKPSDWTKHVHEDVQPFTCTWDKCRDPKIFKRKADWVRHENEGHRHLEWWTCDVEDCRHTCYRRDNFLQHLVREHKFQEPKVKTKAAMKKAGTVDPTWQKVEQCHVETSKQPHEEPCRFCGKVFPTWKKLTVHLAKHMEQISLPVLRLVAAKAKELAADTIISPVQDPPPRHDIPLIPDQKSPAAMRYLENGQQQLSSAPPMPPQQPVSYPQAQAQFMYHSVMPPGQFHQQPFYSPPQFDSIGQSLHQTQSMAASPLAHGYDPGRRVQDLPVTSAPYVQGSNPYTAMTIANEVEPFPPLNALGLQNVPVPVAAPPMGAQMAYDNMMDPSSVHGSPFSGHESLSTYSHSPHQGAIHIDTKGWDDRQVSGYF
ncbi:c2h2 finger domain-containing [Trichoderma arundinaceum]|uniref:C2h2 finger domain-containing n=1 Tax=Trichoderma arundinaceum TaxID=490622 RepID=A0A395N902_TRIAR|nr:c2h2 finger domain-containing [Trichoderma arundinaceum]